MAVELTVVMYFRELPPEEEDLRDLLETTYNCDVVDVEEEEV
jgi:hypothetical protein